MKGLLVKLTEKEFDNFFDQFDNYEECVGHAGIDVFGIVLSEIVFLLKILQLFFLLFEHVLNLFPKLVGIK